MQAARRAVASAIVVVVVVVRASYLDRSIAFKGSLDAATRSSSDWMRGEKWVVGRGGMSGWVVEVASGEREEEMRALAAACSASVGARSMSGVCWLACALGDGSGRAVTG